MSGTLSPAKRAFINHYAVSGDVAAAERAAGIPRGSGAGWLSNARVKREIADIRRQVSAAIQPVHDLAAELGGTVTTRVRTQKSILAMSKGERRKALKKVRAEMAKLRGPAET